MKKQKFTISQALRRIKKLKGELAKQNERVGTAVLYQKGNEPAFTYDDSVAARDAARAELLELSTAVAVANAGHTLEFDGMEMPLAGALRILQEIKAQIAEYKGLVYQSRLRNKNETVDITKREKFEDVLDSDGEFKGQRRVEVEEKTTIMCHLTEADRAKAVEKLESKFEGLNDQLERANHNVVFEVGDK